jgi:hypothetical protein
MSGAIDIAGKRFGRWTVIAYAGGSKWSCTCDCGARGVVRAWDPSNSCRSCAHLKHGHSCKGRRTRIYAIWAAMLTRCCNPSCRGYSNYGGRGITVCERWHSFVNFLVDMGEPPPGLSINRINNDGNYEPGNCRWATRSEQRRNRRPQKLRIKLGDPKILAELKQPELREAGHE